MKKITFKHIGLITASLLFAVQIGGCTKGIIENCSDELIEKVKKK
jgi:hypothetical protein